jgi:hypothetical protein
MECLQLRVQAIVFTKNKIIVRNGNGTKDRITMLPESLKPPLHYHLNEGNIGDGISKRITDWNHSDCSEPPDQPG